MIGQPPSSDDLEMVDMHPDGERIARVCEGDVDALGELYAQYKMQVYRTALAVTHDERAAEDILQEVFVRLYKHAAHINRSVCLAPWLYRVTVNLSYSLSSRLRRWLGVLDGVLEWLAGPHTMQPEFQMEMHDLQTSVRRAIATLPLKQRAVVTLYYLEELSVEEIATTLDVPVGTVKSRLFYAREHLRTLLEAEQRLVPEVAYDFT